jgi:hypothetical protein
MSIGFTVVICGGVILLGLVVTAIVLIVNNQKDR